jgi:hypothetical protein
MTCVAVEFVASAAGDKSPPDRLFFPPVAVFHNFMTVPNDVEGAALLHSIACNIPLMGQ